MKHSAILLIAAALAFSSAASERHTTDLSGIWQWRTDTSAATEPVSLPGTMDTNGKGIPNDRKGETTQLSRKVTYAGPAYYTRTVDIPRSWKDTDIRLFLERTRPTTVWVDGKRAGSCRYLSVPHVYNLSDLLTPGRHTLTIMVDNGDSIPQQIKDSSHACTEATQTNWNGIIGRIELQSAPRCHIESVDFTPDVATRCMTADIRLSSPYPRRKGVLTIESGGNSATVRLSRGDTAATATLCLGDTARLWSEFSPARHKVTTRLDDSDTLTGYAALRSFTADTHQFAINDTVTFLRGRHDACVFPLTGFPPMDTESWRRYFRTIKEYGLNHVRFHSWCPPEACFEAADIEGIYLQPELTIWGTFNESEAELMDVLHADGMAIQKAYGNHPSFVMFGLGNELWGELPLMQRFASDFRAADSRRLYTYGSNAYLGWQGDLPGQEFWVTCRTGGGNGYSAHVRASFAFCDADEGGILNNTYPNTQMNFEDAVLRSQVPVIGHETAQYQFYPDYGERAKYTGVLEPRNLDEFHRRLEASGMEVQAQDFFKATGKWAADLYKADMEMNLRTPSMGGFQLLDIQDYPGQGTALVGILDAFMDSKGLVTPERWRQSCDRTVIMAEFPSYCLVEGDSLRFDISCANYSGNASDGDVRWTLGDDNGVIASGTFHADIPQGYSKLGNVALQLPATDRARKLHLSLGIDGTDTKNEYPLWSYPADRTADTRDIVLADSLDDNVVRTLRAGGKVLLTPRRELVDSTTVGGLFQTDYWNYRMFRTICENNGKPVSPGTMGILADPAHPALAEFPNDGRSDWQWYAIVKASYPLILDRYNDEGYLPIVQTIDNIERNHRLGLVMEFNVDGGKLLLLMADPKQMSLHPEGEQFLKSLTDYMQSDAFSPAKRITSDELRCLLTEPRSGKTITTLRNISYD